MQAKDIPEAPVLRFLATLTISATWYPGFANSVQHAMPDGTPEKVVLAKMRAMVKRGLVSGCACGCRGDFMLTPSGHDALND